MKTTKTNKIPSQAQTTFVLGFTLIEVLIVIAIIGILSTMIISSIQDARPKARDAQRVRDIRTIQTALEMYYGEHGRYPSSTSIGTSGGGGNHWANSAYPSWETLESVLGVTLPRDPINNVQDSPPSNPSTYGYGYSSYQTGSNACSKQQYRIVYNKESGDCGSHSNFVDCSGNLVSYAYWCVVGISPRR